VSSLIARSTAWARPYGGAPACHRATKPRIDVTEWPIVVVEWPQEPSREDVDEHFQEIRALALQANTLAIVVDMTASGTPPAKLRQHAARRLKETYAVVGSRVVAVAHVITSPVVRGILTAVYWLSPPPFPTVVVGTRAAAVDWVRERTRGP
jgi:hypothetical protein